MSSFAPSAPLPAAALAQLQAGPTKPAAGLDTKKAHASAADFESVFLSSMFQQMYTGIDGEGPFGGSRGVGVWRSFLTDQYAKSVVKAGGIGLAKDVYRTLLQHQAAGTAAASRPPTMERPRP